MDLFFILAHSLASDSGVISGFLHPILGFEHLLAMVAVGLLSAQIGGRAIWTVPLAFVVTMVIGGIAGFVLSAEMPFLQQGIALSIVLLGGIMVLQQDKRSLPEIIALVIVALFAVFHGYAHGAEVPLESSLIFFVAYVFGFFIATVGLHVLGALIGYIAMRSDRGTMILRASGVIIAAIGIYFLI
ncbi:MAG: HupE/UreJ family protein [Chloroflexota bacterium]